MTHTTQETSLPADTSIDSLKQVAQKKMELLNQHQKRFEAFKSDLDLLRRRYSVRQSLIDTAAQWYGNQTLWQKLILTAEVIGIALVAGLLLNTLALLTIVSAYIGLVYLFHDHNSRDAKRENDICENIVKMEQCLAESIESFNAVEAKLVEVFEAIFQKNEALAAYSDDLDKKLVLLNEQIPSLQKTIAGLTEVKRVFDESQSHIQSSENQFSLDLDNFSSEILGCTTVISTVTKDLDKTISDSPKLTLVKSDLTHCETSLTQLTEALAEQLKIAKAQSKQCGTMQLTVETARSGISSATRLLDEQLALGNDDQDEISSILERSKDMHGRAQRAMATRKKDEAMPIERVSLALVPTL